MSNISIARLGELLANEILKRIPALRQGEKEQAVIEAAKDFQRVRYQKGVSRDEYKQAEAAFGKAVRALQELEE